jgi:hypothetical protein
VYYRSAVSMAGTIHRARLEIRPGNSTQNNEGSHGTQLTA